MLYYNNFRYWWQKSWGWHLILLPKEPWMKAHHNRRIWQFKVLGIPVCGDRVWGWEDVQVYEDGGGDVWVTDLHVFGIKIWTKY